MMTVLHVAGYNVTQHDQISWHRVVDKLLCWRNASVMQLQDVTGRILISMRRSVNRKESLFPLLRQLSTIRPRSAASMSWHLKGGLASSMLRR
jgi:hypothetical protein